MARAHFANLGYVAVLVGATTGLVGCDSCNKSSDTTADAGASSDHGGTLLPTDTDGGVVNVTPLPTASVSKMVNPGNLPAYRGPTGSVEGTITVEGDPAPIFNADFRRCPDAEKSWGHSFREGGAAPNGKGRLLGDAIVVVTGYTGFYLPEKAEAATVTIEGCGYTQRTVTLTFGQRLEIVNKSKEFWTPILEPGPNPVLRMAAPNSDPVRLYPNKPGHWLLGDHDRRYAITDVYAFLHPLHASTDLEGHYRIDGLPVGKVKVGVTHPQIGDSVEIDLDVKENVVARVDATLTYVHKEAGAPSDAGAKVDAGTKADAGTKGHTPVMSHP